MGRRLWAAWPERRLKPIFEKEVMEKVFINWFLTIFFWLSLLLEVRKIVKRSEMEEWEEKVAFILCGILFFIAGAIHGAYTLAIPIHLYLFWAFILRGIFFWIVSVLTAEEPFLRTKKLLSKEGEIAITRVIALIILIFLLLGLVAFFGVRSISYWQATTFKGMVDEFQKGSIELFPEIDPEDVRVTTSTIARSIAEIKRTSAESWITSVHLGMYEGELSWICTISEKPTFGMWLIGSSNAIREVIVIPVTDATGERAKVIPFRAFYAEGLWFGNEIKVRANNIFPLRSISRGYITSQDERLVLVTTSYVKIPLGPLIDPKVHVWDPITGELIGEYTPYNAPEWIVQRWDEEMLEIMGDAFGDFRWTAENELNYWNGIPRFSDRSADPSEPEGLRYQMWNGELTAVYLFDNKRNKQVLELVIIATKEGLKVYSVDHLGLLSPDDAKELALSGLPALPEGKNYHAPIALIYRIGLRLFYHIPIYIQSQGRYYPAYFALVDCQSRSYIRESVEKYGGMTETIKAVYEKVGVPSKEKIIEGKVVDKDEWVEKGNTRIWLTLNVNGTEVNVLVKTELLTSEEIHLVLDKQVGDRITVKIDENNVVTKVVS